MVQFFYWPIGYNKNQFLAAMDTVHIGTSGFSYSYWKNRFYPEKLPASQWLQYYSTQFNTVELNSTFYRFPIVKNLQKSAYATPADFRFTVKAHKIITHTRRMKDVKEKIKEFVGLVHEGLGDKLACMLYQLPPSYAYTAERLDDVLSALAGDSNKNVVEFRHLSWWNKEVYKAFKSNGLTFCSVSFPGLPEDNILTGKVFYKRMHGVPGLFKSSYSEAQLQALAGDVPKRKQSFIYFNNTMFEAGYTNAAMLKGLLAR
jgi:uncharacterized protein YecE (DUF72 family)